MHRIHFTLVIPAIAALSCVSPAPRPPSRTDPDPSCEDACNNVVRLGCNPERPITVADCLAVCRSREDDRPGSTAATCKSQAATCEALRACNKEAR